MDLPVVLFATVLAKDGAADQVLNVLTGMLEPSRNEDGCINYDLHRDSENPNRFVFHETWLSPKHLDDHTKTQHYVDTTAKLGDLTESITLLRTTKL